MSAPIDLLDTWLKRQLSEAPWQWLSGRRAELAQTYTDRALHITLGMIPRRLGKQDLALSSDDLEEAEAARPGWNPKRWSVSDAARVLVLIETAESGNQSFAERFVDLCRSADVGELIALYRGLALYPDPAALENQAAEGLRTNMRGVFEAVAHNSPYPREQFTQDRWNQMVLKALFIDSSLKPVQGLDQRANPELARIMCDYAHERWSAMRSVTPELWRCVGPFAEGPMLDDLARALASDVQREQQAAALALAASPDTKAAALLASAPELKRLVESRAIDWNRLPDSEG